MFHLLVDNKANLGDGSENCPLFFAAKKNNLEMVSVLIKGGAKPNNSGSYSYPLEEAVGNNNAQMVDLLIKNGADVGDRLQGKQFPVESMLMIAIKNRNREIVEILIKSGSNVDCIIHGEKYGMNFVTPLILATFMSEVEIANMLVASGADIEICVKCIDENNLLYNKNLSPIITGYFNNMFSTVELMTKRGNCLKRTHYALIEAIMRADIEAVKMIVTMYGRGIIVMEKDGVSAITKAIKNNEAIEIKQLFIEVLSNKVPYNNGVNLKMCIKCGVERANVGNEEMCLHCLSITRKDYKDISFNKLYNFDGEEVYTSCKLYETERVLDNISFDKSMESMDYSCNSSIPIMGKSRPKNAKKGGCSCIVS